MSNRSIERANKAVLVAAGVAGRSSVSASTSGVTLLAANESRVAATFYNDTVTGKLYLALGAGATTTNFTVLLGPQEYYEQPTGYTGIVTGIWDFADGSVRVTELVP